MNRVRRFRGLWSRRLQHHLLGRDRLDTKVMVLPTARSLYVPIPKAANTSARTALLPVLGIDPASVRDVHHDPRIHIRPASRAMDLAGPGWFVFTIVRNPYTRALSAWRDKVVRREAEMHALRIMGVEKSDSFETFLEACASWVRPMLNDHFMPQADLLARPMKRADLQVYRFETLEQDWPEICKKIIAQGADSPSELPQHNQSGAPGTGHVFTDREIALIQDLYAKDFHAFGYDLQPPK